MYCLFIYLMTIFGFDGRMCLTSDRNIAGCALNQVKTNGETIWPTFHLIIWRTKCASNAWQSSISALLNSSSILISRVYAKCMYWPSVRLSSGYHILENTVISNDCHIIRDRVIQTVSQRSANICLYAFVAHVS